MRPDETPQDPTPDPALAAALRSLADEPPLESVDWERLRTSIAARAELPLARLRARGSDRPVPARAAARLARPLLPLAVAASVALAVWVGTAGEPPAAESAARLPVEEAFRPDLSEQEFRLLVSGGTDPEALLRLALDGS